MVQFQDIILNTGYMLLISIHSMVICYMFKDYNVFVFFFHTIDSETGGWNYLESLKRVGCSALLFTKFVQEVGRYMNIFNSNNYYYTSRVFGN